jgi:hypothetical protein
MVSSAAKAYIQLLKWAPVVPLRAFRMTMIQRFVHHVVDLSAHCDH